MKQPFPYLKQTILAWDLSMVCALQLPQSFPGLSKITTNLPGWGEKGYSLQGSGLVGKAVGWLLDKGPEVGRLTEVWCPLPLPKSQVFSAWISLFSTTTHLTSEARQMPHFCNFSLFSPSCPLDSVQQIQEYEVVKASFPDLPRLLSDHPGESNMVIQN